MAKIEPIIIKTRSGREIKRYDICTQKSTAKNIPNVNIGVTPKGTRYYRAVLPDKSWSSLYLRKKDGSEVIVDSCSSAFGFQASVLNKKPDGIISSDKYIEHMTNGAASKNRIVADRMVGQTSKTYIQDEVKKAMSFLAESVDKCKTLPKPNFWVKLWRIIK